jgi:hypothetical protein
MAKHIRFQVHIQYIIFLGKYGVKFFNHKLIAPPLSAAIHHMKKVQMFEGKISVRTKYKSNVFTF